MRPFFLLVLTIVWAIFVGFFRLQLADIRKAARQDPDRMLVESLMLSFLALALVLILFADYIVWTVLPWGLTWN